MRVCSAPACEARHEAKGLCAKHYSRVQRNGTTERRERPTPEARFWARLTPPPAGDCWHWAGYVDPQGYARLTINRKPRKAGRFAYELLRAEIPEGLFLDHLCRNRVCVNPWHLEPVTNRENVRRGVLGEVTRLRHAAKTHCPRGHEYTPENTYTTKAGGRTCRTCNRIRGRKRLAAERLDIRNAGTSD